MNASSPSMDRWKRLPVLLAAVLAVAGLYRPSRADDSAGSPSFQLRTGIAVSQHQGVKERNLEYRVASRYRTGFTAGASLLLPVTKRFGVQQEINYVQRGSRQKIGATILEIPTDLDVTYDLDYLEIPSLFRFAWTDPEPPTLYSLFGFAFSLRVRDRYRLSGEVDDGEQVIPLRADADLSEVDLFDYSLVYGVGSEITRVAGRALSLEYRFTLGWNELRLPTYAYVPFGDDDEILVDEAGPVPLHNQSHTVAVGWRF